MADQHSTRRGSIAKSSRISQFFSTSPKSKISEASSPSATSTLLQIKPASVSLPTISLSTAPSDNASSVDPPTNIFTPPSPAELKRISRQHAQFGPLGHPTHRHVSRYQGRTFPKPIIDEPPYYFFLTTYFSYLVLLAFGHVRDFFGKRFRKEKYQHLRAHDGYGPLNDDFDSFYVRRLKMRLNDCFARPVFGVPGRFITLLDRTTDDHNLHFQLTGSTTQTLNMSSYNYLGFAQSEGPCADAVEDAVRKCGMSLASSRSDAGTSELHLEVEELIASFVGKQAAMVFSMGFVTNATAFPALVGKGCLIISDELNHASIRNGARLSGALLKTFVHNDMKDLEKILREHISQGQPRTHRPWKKILVVVEGLYSMEGTMCNLPGLVALRKKYGFYLFVDEAHSIGALGPRGRGVCDYFGISTSEVDVLMGTLTKSFGANGGYLAADEAIIDKLRVINAGGIYGEAPTPPVLMQIASSLRIIAGDILPGQGEERLQRLAFNSRYLRLGLKRLGFIIYGHDDSPIIPLLLYNPAKMPAFSREMLNRKISVVVVGYPATPLVASRARFCVSAAHTKEDLDQMLAACDEVGDLLQLKFSSGVAGGAHPQDGGVAEVRRGRRVAGKRMIQDTAAAQGVKPRWQLQDVVRTGAVDVKFPLK